MSLQFSSDTICALSTAPGMGAIALVRVSGKRACASLSNIFSKDLTHVDSHTTHFGYIRTTNGDVLDEVLITVLREGKSFTGEETVEIACHGSVYIQQEILRLLTAHGCRMAEPGEFTMRAFHNGKLDLSQAEAVADLIASESQMAHRVAMKQMKGKFSSELSELRSGLIHFASLVELELDFAEEDVEFADRSQLLALVEQVMQRIQQLIQSFRLGNALKKGIPVALVGAPNSGKSTLLNQLVEEDRAIVSPIAGTTRDVIEATMNIDGLLFRFIDTAGIRETVETIEALGIERSMEKMQQAQVVLFLIDWSLPDQERNEAIDWVEAQKAKLDNQSIVIANKTDESSVDWKSVPTINCGISARTGEGVEALKTTITQLVLGDFNTQSDTIVTNARHVDALEKTMVSLEQARFALLNGTSGDFVAMDIRQAMFQLGTITGEIATDDLLGNIFSKFCIGK